MPCEGSDAKSTTNSMQEPKMKSKAAEFVRLLLRHGADPATKDAVTTFSALH